MINLTTIKLKNILFVLCLILSIHSYSQTTYKLYENVKFETYQDWVDYSWNEGSMPTSADNLDFNQYTIEINFNFPSNLNGISFLNSSWGGSSTNLIINGSVSASLSTQVPLNLTVKENGYFDILSSVNQPSQPARIVVEEGGTLIIQGEISYQQHGTFLDISGDVIIYNDLSLGNSNTSVNINKTGSLEVRGDVNHTNWGVNFNVCGYMAVSGDVNLNGGLIIDLTCGCANFDEEACECVGVSDQDFGRLEIGGNFDFQCNSSNNIIGACNVSVGEGCTVCDENQGGDLCENVDLPVTLLYFKGEKTSEGHLLSWKTGTEQNTSHFDVEISNDKRNWSVLGTVAAAGNSNVPLIYNFIDTKMTHQYYRLAQYDLDGAVSYYGVVSINSDDLEFSVNVYPTELTNGEELFIQLSGVNTNMPAIGTFYTMEGKLLGIVEISNGEGGVMTKSMVIPESPEGVVLMKITNGKNSVTKKLLVH
ncbi:hypothetical protein [Flammeovirga sp. SJP92]|uniref:hypothetical protein n=1 Tax=Flammeovirga sp. SJP92 TaxID=1775430 RepID=UPI00078833FB|nr:hypothetical protein [Flammeovirga sp. SJP92]KXX71478.1 hypothetical protein AVL50_06130 [Flammeovirga sp. SJP92]